MGKVVAGWDFRGSVVRYADACRSDGPDAVEGAVAPSFGRGNDGSNRHSGAGWSRGGGPSPVGVRFPGLPVNYMLLELSEKWLSVGQHLHERG